MSDAQTLEEAWRNHGLALTSEELDDTARALALAAFDMARAAGSVGSILEQIERQREWRRQIEELGR